VQPPWPEFLPKDSERQSARGNRLLGAFGLLGFAYFPRFTIEGLSSDTFERQRPKSGRGVLVFAMLVEGMRLNLDTSQFVGVVLYGWNSTRTYNTFTAATASPRRNLGLW
jgi:hypothetical protein